MRVANHNGHKDHKDFHKEPCASLCSLRPLWLILAICVCAILVYVTTRGTSTSTGAFPPMLAHSEKTNTHTIKNNIINNNTGYATSTKRDYIPSRAERRAMSDKDRIALFERLGYIPSPSDPSDYFLAEKTSWWGKRLDPQEFWTNRVLWLDGSAKFEARRRGRGYPPIPYDEPAVAHNSDMDVKVDGFEIEGSQPNYVYSEREMIFWNYFCQTHPRPPHDIHDWLRGHADSWLAIKYKLKNDPETVKLLKITSQRLERDLTRTLRETTSSMLPPECITPEAYHWDHVMRKREEYEKLVASDKSGNPLPVKLFFNHVYVDHALITEPLTAEQINAANAWKVAYLKRLRAEKWDESYINAYLDAWDLTEEYVFGNRKDE